jgi:hypothetical protein
MVEKIQLHYSILMVIIGDHLMMILHFSLVEPSLFSLNGFSQPSKTSKLLEKPHRKKYSHHVKTCQLKDWIREFTIEERRHTEPDQTMSKCNYHYLFHTHCCACLLHSSLPRISSNSHSNCISFLK